MTQRVVLDLHMPLDVDTFVKIEKALRKEFPHAVIGDSGQKDVVRILSEPSQQVPGNDGGVS